MAILIGGEQLRLTGEDATSYLRETGRARLPTTVTAYNKGIEDAIQSWLNVGSPEALLLAAFLRESLIDSQRE